MKCVSCKARARLPRLGADLGFQKGGANIMVGWLRKAKLITTIGIVCKAHSACRALGGLGACPHRKKLQIKPIQTTRGVWGDAHSGYFWNIAITRLNLEAIFNQILYCTERLWGGWVQL